MLFRITSKLNQLLKILSAFAIIKKYIFVILSAGAPCGIAPFTIFPPKIAQWHLPKTKPIKSSLLSLKRNPSALPCCYSHFPSKMLWLFLIKSCKCSTFRVRAVSIDLVASACSFQACLRSEDSKCSNRDPMVDIVA